MTRRRGGWWVARALGRTPLARAVDRLDALVLVVGILLVLVVTYLAGGIGQSLYDGRLHAVADQAATRHLVDATALAPSRAIPSDVELPSAGYQVHVQYSGPSSTQDQLVTTDRPVRSGENVPIWLDDQGKVTSAPESAGDTRFIAFGTAALLWLAACIAIGAVVSIVRRVLDRSRDRAWDRGLLELMVRNDGGPTRRTP